MSLLPLSFTVILKMLKTHKRALPLHWLWIRAPPRSPSVCRRWQIFSVFQALCAQNEQLEEAQITASNRVSTHKQATQLLQTELQDSRAQLEERDMTIQTLRSKLRESEVGFYQLKTASVELRTLVYIQSSDIVLLRFFCMQLNLALLKQWALFLNNLSFCVVGSEKLFTQCSWAGKTPH